MAAVATAVGAGAEFTYKEKVYTVSACTYEVQAAFEKYLERYAIDTHYRMARMLSEDDSEKSLSNLQRDLASGAYNFGGDQVRKALDSLLHLRYMVYLVLKKNHPEISIEQVKEMFETNRDNLMLAVNRANADPNVQTPTAATE